MANMSIFSLALVVLIHISQSTNAYNGLSFKLIHRESLNSPSTKYNLTVEEQVDRLIQSSEGRLKYLGYHSRGNSTLYQANDDEVIRPPLYPHSAQNVFLVQMAIGTYPGSYPPFKPQLLELDTGSGPIWTQCEGCYPCFHQEYPVFTRHQSRSYRPLNCGECPRGTKCELDHCRDDHSYGDGTHVRGIAAYETFTFSSNDGGGLMQMQRIRFTCVIWTEQFVLAADGGNRASGIFGMSLHTTSFMSQVGANLGGRFSYCFTPLPIGTNPGQQPPMHLRFGDDIPPLNGMYRTSFVPNPFKRYYLNLEAIIVGTEVLNIHPSVYQLTQNNAGGCFIDSGAAVTRLITAAYHVFEEVLMRQIQAMNPRIEIYTREPRLCFKQPRAGARTEFPTVTFHFQNNAYFVILQEAYMLGFAVRRPQVYCLMIVPFDRATVLGAYQQVNHRIIYDISRSELQFAPANCAADN